MIHESAQCLLLLIKACFVLQQAAAIGLLLSVGNGSCTNHELPTRLQVIHHDRPAAYNGCCSSILDLTYDVDRKALAFQEWSREQFQEWTKEVEIKCRLRDAQGKPIASHHVRSIVNVKNLREGPLVLRVDKATVTDQLGHFIVRFLNRDGFPAIWMRDGEGWKLLKPVDDALRLSDSVDSESPAELIDMVVADASYEFRIQVLNASGAAVAGAPIVLHFGEDGDSLPWLSAFRTDETGEWRGSGFAHGPWWLHVSVPGSPEIRLCPHQFRATEDADLKTVVTIPEGIKVGVYLAKRTSGQWFRFSFQNDGSTIYTELWRQSGIDGSVQLVLPRWRDVVIDTVDDGEHTLELWTSTSCDLVLRNSMRK